MSGFFTPTEASVVVCLYAIILGLCYRELRIAQLPEIIWKSIRQAASLLFIMAAANFFGYFVILKKVPDQIITTLMGFGAGSATVLLIIIAIVLVLGCFLEGNAIFLITLPIFVPICRMYSIDLVNFGVVMTLLIMIGNLTPPVGMCLFAVDSFARVGIPALTKQVWPYLLVIFLVTVLIAFVPAIALYLPNAIMGAM